VLSPEASDSFGLQGRRPGTPVRFTFLAGLVDPGPDPLAEDLALEFGKDG
jgi:hypothetical protein